MLAQTPSHGVSHRIQVSQFLDIRTPNYARLLFIDFSSAFNTVSPFRLYDKLMSLELNVSVCKWILDFLLDRSQIVKIGTNYSKSLVLNTGTPQGCILSPLLYSLFTYDCVTTCERNFIVKYADDTTVAGLITNDETS